MALESLLVLLVLAAPASAARPHIVFVLADDYGFNDISYHARKNGNDTNIIETPTLDALAAQGVKLENYYVQPVCSPTRAALLTGRYGSHTGINVPLVDSAPGGLPLHEVLLPQLLREVGYRTHAVGKWHLGFETWGHTPEERGFASYFGYYAGSTDYYTQQSECWAGPVAPRPSTDLLTRTDTAHPAVQATGRTAAFRARITASWSPVTICGAAAR